VASRASFADAAIWAADARDHATLARVASQAMQMEGFVLRFDEADRWARVAAEASARTGGDRYVEAERLYSLGYLAWRRTQYDEAEAQLRRALTVYASLTTRRTYEELAANTVLATVLGDAGKWEQAAALNRAVRDQAVALFGPDHRRTVGIEENIALDQFERGELDEALKGEASVVARRNVLYAQGAAVAEGNYGWMLIDAGRAGEAVQHFLNAVAIAESINGEHDDELAYAQSGLGAAYVAMGREHVALGPLEDALRRQTSDAQAVDRAVTRFALAQALWAATPERKRAIELAQQARATLAAHPLGIRRQRQLDAVAAWLRARGAR
jgi:tetratricopeptide (TPR) repeat protein